MKQPLICILLYFTHAVQLLSKLNLPPPSFDDVFELRAGANERLDEAKAALGGAPDGVEEEDVEIPLRNGEKNRAILFKPTKRPASGSPLVVLFHGGGFCIGAPEGETPTARNLTQSLGATCISASYRLAPENPFPAAIEDAWDALEWAAANAQQLGANPSAGFVVGGTSAGGNISAVLALLARDEKLSPPLTGQYLAIPATCPPDVLPERYQHMVYSYAQNKEAPVLPQKAIDLFMTNYKADKNNWHFVPMNHPNGHAGVPPAFFQICGLDPLRDEALVYDKMLREEAGVKTRLDMYPGVPHGFWSFFPMLSSAAKFRKEQMEGVGWLLGKAPELQKVQLKAVANVA